MRQCHHNSIASCDIKTNDIHRRSGVKLKTSSLHMTCGSEWDMRNMMPGLQDGDTAAFLRVLPQDSGVHTRWWRYPKDGGVGVFSYKMSVLPTRWRRYPKDGGTGVFVLMKCWRYQQDGGFTHKMPTRWRQCRVSASFTHKMATRQFCLQDGSVTNKMVALHTRRRCTYKMTMFMRVLPSEATHVTIKKII